MTNRGSCARDEVGLGLAVNIYDIEIAHGIEGTGGTLLLAVDTKQSQMFGEALAALGFQVAHEQ